MTKEHECSCDKCAAMCKRFPCRPLPEEIQNMPPEVQARLMFNDGCGMRDIPHLQPAVKGHEGADGTYDFNITWGGMSNPGECTFLTKDGLCELHGKCKPWEGRMALHDNKGNDEYQVLLDAWDTDEGLAVVEKWREECAAR